MSEEQLTGPAAQTLDSILSLDLATCTVTICLASAEEDAEVPTFETLQITDGLADDFRSIAAAAFTGCTRAQAKGDLVLCEYDAAYKPDKGDVEHLDLSTDGAKSISQQLAALSSIAGLPAYSGSSEFAAGLRFYVIILQPPDGDAVYLFRSYTQRRELTRSSWFGVFLADGQYDRFRQPMLLFDNYIDCFACKDILFVLKKENFHKIFRYLEMVRKVAKETLTAIRTNIPVANFDVLEDSCEDSTLLLAKLRNISRSPHLSKLSMSSIRASIERLGLSIQIVEKDGQELLVFDPRRKREFFKLLEDGYLDSQMTGQSYEVNSKRVLARQ